MVNNLRCPYAALVAASPAPEPLGFVPWSPCPCCFSSPTEEQVSDGATFSPCPSPGLCGLCLHFPPILTHLYLPTPSHSEPSPGSGLTHLDSPEQAASPWKCCSRCTQIRPLGLRGAGPGGGPAVGVELLSGEWA